MKKQKANDTLLGAHVSVAGGLYKAVERAEAIGCNTMQIFTKSGRSWFGKPIPEQEAELFKKALHESNLSKIMAHSAYLINIGSPKKEVEKKSLASLKHELNRCEELDIPYLVLHPGAHLGTGEDTCIKQIAKNLDKVFEKAKGKSKILLEVTAGQGTNVGYTFEHIKEIRANCSNKKYIGVCLDTCHAWAGGYDIGTEQGYLETLEKVDKIIGLKNLKAIHLNDSKTELGARKDRHENIGKGHIPRKAFKMIMNDKRLREIPKILETPAIDGEDQYEKEIQLLRKMMDK